MEPNTKEVENQSVLPLVVKPENKPNNSYKALLFLLVIFIVLILLGGIGGLFIFNKNQLNKQVNQAPAITQALSPTPVKSDWQILNSSQPSWSMYLNKK